jgi:hypothetical protein
MQITQAKGNREPDKARGRKTKSPSESPKDKGAAPNLARVVPPDGTVGRLIEIWTEFASAASCIFTIPGSLVSSRPRDDGKFVHFGNAASRAL